MNNPTNEELANASPSIFDAQNEDVKTTEQVLKAMQEDLMEDEPSWETENIDATIELLNEWRR